MNPESNARILCERPLDSKTADRIEAALSDPVINTLCLEFQDSPETEKDEIDQILSEDPLIDRLRRLIRQMEQGPKPVAALVTESIGGLQFEVALACHVRFASAGTIRLDFPWLKYGLMPILGGTQRLPRLCGIELAARLLLQADKINVMESVASGLFEIKDSSLVEAAMMWAEAHPKPEQSWDRVAQELSSTYSQRASNRQLLENIYLKLRRRASAEEAAPTAILRCFQDGLERSIDAGIRLEKEQWSMVRRSRSTLNRVNTLHLARQKALQRGARHSPFAVHGSGERLQPSPVIEETSIKRIGVLGAGLMGTGIAYTAARAGYEVLVVEVSQEASQRSFQRMEKMAEQDGNSDLLKRRTPGDLLNRVRWTADIAVLAECDFVVEAVFERPSLKKEKLAEIADLVDPAATVASNTTTLPISDLALACHRPERFLGTHFFAPVDRMELLEIVVGEKTASDTIDRAILLAKALDKTPIIVRDGPGFFTSRVVAAYLQEALLMVREGISPWMIDNVAQNAGMILGPLTMADLMSLDLLAEIFESLAKYQRGAARDSADSVKILREFIDQSGLGRKNGAGIYQYNSRGERVDLAGFRTRLTPETVRPAPEEIEQRLFVIQTIEALHAIREGIIEDIAMADLASVLGWSYPAGRGGVMSYLDFIGREEFERVRSRLQERFGRRFAMPG
jgi:3-hydroxyacyl-CoA dehydrogenase / enoyl-CoA hydratase / 3-hydroxybutyryl-CoA epimerase